jgi:hypothetical protein
MHAPAHMGLIPWAKNLKEGQGGTFEGSPWPLAGRALGAGTHLHLAAGVAATLLMRQALPEHPAQLPVSHPAPSTQHSCPYPTPTAAALPCSVALSRQQQHPACRAATAHPTLPGWIRQGGCVLWASQQGSLAQQYHAWGALQPPS